MARPKDVPSTFLCFLSQGPRTKYCSPLAIAIIPSAAVSYLIFCFPANLIRKSIRNRLITVEVIIVIAKHIHPIPAIEAATFDLLAIKVKPKAPAAAKIPAVNDSLNASSGSVFNSRIALVVIPVW
jgi:hypothetical protein